MAGDDGPCAGYLEDDGAGPGSDCAGYLYEPAHAQYEKVLDVYARKDNAMFVPESGNAAPYARYFFATLGHGAIGWSTFGLDLTGYANAPLGAPVVDDKLIDLFALNNEIVGPMQHEIAKLNFEGKVQAVAEDPAVHSQNLAFGPWTASVAYGLRVFGASGECPWKRGPGGAGAAVVAQLGPDEFLVTGVSTRVDFRLTDAASGKHRELLRRWKKERMWMGNGSSSGSGMGTRQIMG